jgi:F-type H+-transporting ATPase subunit a
MALDINKAFEHVQDADHWHLFNNWDHVELPRIFGLQITKFMLLELLAAALIALIYIPLARRARDGSLPKGRFWNAFESLLTFVREEIAKPNLHGHDADKFTPYLWTVFLFILFCNLFGMFPFLGSPTASIWVTGALGLCSFVLFHAAPIRKMGFVHYLQAMWPHIDVPYLGPVLSLSIFSIEMLGTVIKSFVLAVRLFANMFAGHMVLATILLFIVASANTALWVVITPASVIGIAALSLLELFVAFLQAYVFTFLTALFLGMLLHPEH